MIAAALGPTDRRRESFRRFNEHGGKFRLSITNVCNLRCFFCHNEGMPLDRGPTPLSAERLVELANAYAALGGQQINITGGEPLAHPRLPEILESIERRSTRVVLNSNGLLFERLTGRPRISAIDTILVSLHTTDNQVFTKDLGGRDIGQVQRGILALRDHGYRVKINCSLGPHNAADVRGVMRFAAEHEVDLKIIALVRPNEEVGFYRGEWVDPATVTELVGDLGVHLGREVHVREQLGGRIATWRFASHTLEVKNIAQGRLRTDFCGGCAHTASCGEGIYGLRIGVDGVLKPCLLRRERWREVDAERAPEEQILDAIDAMVGDWSRATFVTGAPQ